MRVPNPRLVRYGGLTKGSIVEAGDGELVVTPLMQPIIELGSPINIVTPVGTLLPANHEDSFYKDEQFNFTGAVAQQQVDFGSMARGAWHFDFQATFGFTGTTNIANFSRMLLIDPDGNTSAIFNFPHITGYFAFAAQYMTLTFQRDGFLFRLQHNATVALDVLFLAAGISGRRIL